MFVVIDLTVNFHHEHFIDPTNCPWVSEHVYRLINAEVNDVVCLHRIRAICTFDDANVIFSFFGNFLSVTKLIKGSYSLQFYTFTCHLYFETPWVCPCYLSCWKVLFHFCLCLLVVCCSRFVSFSLCFVCLLVCLLVDVKTVNRLISTLLNLTLSLTPLLILGFVAILHFRFSSFSNILEPIVENLDSVIHWIILYPVDSAVGIPNVYPLDSDLSRRQCQAMFE